MTTGALLIDLGPVPAVHCDDCLEDLFKAMAVDPAGDAERSMWAPHPLPGLREHVEDVTRRMQRVLEALQDAFARALTGSPLGTLAKAEGSPWLRWTEPDFNAARLHLEATEPRHYTLDDWMLLVDWLVHYYLPDGVINDMAEYLAVRAAIMGKVQATIDAGVAPQGIDLSTLVHLVPTEFARVPPRALSPIEVAVMQVSKARAAIHIRDVSDTARSQMKRMVIEHVQAQILGQKEGTTERLRSRLFDAFGQLNRDFRRIAVTESGECHNQGFIAALAPGRKVRRIEAYKGACDFCHGINGRIFRVVDPTDPAKDGDRDVWVGKTNVGRSASPRKRVGGALVDREPEELWWVAAGVQHPHCRGSWAFVADDTPANVDPGFDAWLSEIVAKHAPSVAADRIRDAAAAN